MVRKSVAVLCTIAFVILSVAPLTALAAIQNYETKTIDGVTYAYNDEIGWVTGNANAAGDVQIADQIEGHPVAYIEDNAFQYAAITSVTIPGSIRAIGKQAFYYTNLQKAEIADGVQSVGDLAFAGTFLKNGSLPVSVTELGQEVFGSADTNYRWLDNDLVPVMVDSITYGGTTTQWRTLTGASETLEAYFSPIPVACTDGMISPDWDISNDTSWLRVMQEGPTDTNLTIGAIARQGTLTAHLTTHESGLELLPWDDPWGEGIVYPSPSENVTIEQGENGSFYYAATPKLAGVTVYIEGQLEIDGRTEEFSVAVPGGAPAKLPSWVDVKLRTPSVASDGVVKADVSIPAGDPDKSIFAAIDLLDADDNLLTGWFCLLGGDRASAAAIEIDLRKLDMPYTGRASLAFNGMVTSGDTTEWVYMTVATVEIMDSAPKPSPSPSATARPTANPSATVNPSPAPSAVPAPSIPAVAGYQSGLLNGRTYYTKTSGASMLFYQRRTSGSMGRVSAPYVAGSDGTRYYPVNNGGTILYPRLENGKLTAYCQYRNSQQVPVLRAGTVKSTDSSTMQAFVLNGRQYYARTSGASILFYQQRSSGSFGRVSAPYVTGSNSVRYYPVNCGGTVLIPQLASGQLSAYLGADNAFLTIL